MTKQELIDNMCEMVKYILPKEEHDNDVIANYTDTLVMIAEEYHTEQLKLCLVNYQKKQAMYLLFKHTPENVSNHNRSTNGWDFITDVETLQDFRNKVGDFEDQDYFLQDDGSVTDCDGNEVIDNDPNSTSFDFGDYTYHAIKLNEIDCKYDVDAAKVKAIEEASPHNKNELLEEVVNIDWMEV